jgi:hypothetical protein
LFLTLLTPPASTFFSRFILLSCLPPFHSRVLIFVRLLLSMCMLRGTGWSITLCFFMSYTSAV